MKEFISSNNVKMIEGINFNWCKQSIYYDKEDPFVYQIAIGTLEDMYFATYHQDENYLSFCSVNYSDTNRIKFYVNNLKEAEKLVLSFIKANNFEISKLYVK